MFKLLPERSEFTSRIHTSPSRSAAAEPSWADASVRALLVQRERVQRVAGGHQNVLAAVHHVGLWRIRDLADRGVPQRRAVGRRSQR